MRCQFCHNPDTWTTKDADWQTADEVLKKALRYKNYWGEKGGITVSGGEPLLQIDFLIELFRKAKRTAFTQRWIPVEIRSQERSRISANLMS